MRLSNLITELCEVRLDAPEDVHEKFRASVRRLIPWLRAVKKGATP
jgi:hypothetical protein